MFSVGVFCVRKSKTKQRGSAPRVLFTNPPFAHSLLPLTNFIDFISVIGLIH